jgi:hypothetical protein
MRNRSILAVLGCSLLLGLSPVAADPLIERGIDVFTTPADGNTFYDFSRNPIPAGFFCKGSKPFSGKIVFKGLPLATGVPGELGTVDTVVERLDDAVFDADGRAATRLQFRALSLVSINPLRTACGAFHAYVSLGGQQRTTMMNIHRTEANGGTFVAPLAVDARLTFIPVQRPRGRSPKKLELLGSFTFPATSLPWSFMDGPMPKRPEAFVVDTNGDLTPDTRLPSISNFLVGRAANSPNKSYCCWEEVCHETSGHLHCSAQLPWGCQGECP